MRRILTAALLAAPLLLAVPGPAQANDGPCTYGYGCGGWCLNMFSRIHQHGPLYNYGPYYGYPPFEPYGPWDAYLHYHGQGAAVGGHAKLLHHGNTHPLFHGGLSSLLHHGCKDGSCATGGCSTCGGGVPVTGTAPAAPTAPAKAPTTAYGPYQVDPYQQTNPYAGYPGYGYPGYGYGYNPYAAAAAGYYNQYLPQQVSYPPPGMPLR